VTVRTRAVRDRLVGDARSALKDAAGSNQIVSRTEAKKLPKDVARATEVVRAEKGRVTVDDAVDAYASKVSYVLNAVDTRGKGVLSATEAKRIRDPALRSSVLDVRAKLMAGDSGGTTGTGGTGVPTTSTLVAGLTTALSGTDAFCESGDHGVNISMRKVPGQDLDEVLTKVHLDPAAPWTNGETHVVLTPAGPTADTIATFTSFARDAMMAEREDIPEVIDAFAVGVKAQFSTLSDIRLASGQDLGAMYLIGKTSDGYVAVAVQPYSDG
jgi:hypothetical protein